MVSSSKNSAANRSCWIDDEEGLNLVRLPHFPARSGAFGWLDVACRVVVDVFPGNCVDECPVDHRVDVAHRFGRQARCHLLRNNAGLVPPHCCPCCVDGRLARIGNLTSGRGFALRDPIGPIGIHLAVVVALDSSFGEQRRVELQQLRFVEPLKAFAADPGNHVRGCVVLPVLPRCGIDRRFDGREPLGEELGDCARRRLDDSAAIGFAHRFAAGLPCLFFGVEAALGDPRVIACRWILFGAAEPVVPLRTALAYRAFHDATSSRSPAVTTYTRPPSLRTGSSPDATSR